MSIKQMTVKLQGIEVCCTSKVPSEPGSLPLIMLHAFAASRESFRLVLNRLPETFPVYAYDRPGFGETARPLPPFDSPWDNINPYSREGQVEMLRMFMDALDIPEAVIAGHSVGGIIARLFALRYPSRVKGLILINASIYGKGFSPKTLTLMRTLPGRLAGMLILSFFKRKFDENFSKEFYRPDEITEKTRQVYARLFTMDKWKRGLWEYLSHGPVLDEAEHLEAIRAITQPVLLVHGKEDRRVDPNQSRLQADAFPDAEFHLIDDCGHMTPEEKPITTAEKIVNFVQSL